MLMRPAMVQDVSTDTALLLAALNALRCDNGGAQDLRNISDADWHKLLRLADRTRLTLPIGLRCRGRLPDWVQARIEQNLARTAQRHQRVVESYQEIARLLEARGIEFLVLKG